MDPKLQQRSTRFFNATMVVFGGVLALHLLPLPLAFFDLNTVARFIPKLHADYAYLEQHAGEEFATYFVNTSFNFYLVALALWVWCLIVIAPDVEPPAEWNEVEKRRLAKAILIGGLFSAVLVACVLFVATPFSMGRRVPANKFATLFVAMLSWLLCVVASIFTMTVVSYTRGMIAAYRNR